MDETTERLEKETIRYLNQRNRWLEIRVADLELEVVTKMRELEAIQTGSLQRVAGGYGGGPTPVPVLVRLHELDKRISGLFGAIMGSPRSLDGRIRRLETLAGVNHPTPPTQHVDRDSKPVEDPDA
jgi:hypothetical protein